MWFILNWISYLVIAERTAPVYGAHARIGYYTDLNPKDCGITRLSMGFTDICFEWHKNPLSYLAQGRNSTVDEVTWMAAIRNDNSYPSTWCGGSIIANEWILTAAHCVNKTPMDPLKIEIYLTGLPITPRNTYSVVPIDIHEHPTVDLALLELQYPISQSSSLGYQLKSVCLPMPGIVLEPGVEQELALTAGWGSTNRSNVPVQIGYQKIYTKNHTMNTSIHAKAIDNQGLICDGDSGGALWQFDMRRAVLIGVLSHGMSLCQPNSTFHSVMLFTRVSAFIDWIKGVTQLQ